MIKFDKNEYGYELKIIFDKFRSAHEYRFANEKEMACFTSSDYEYAVEQCFEELLQLCVMLAIKTVQKYCVAEMPLNNEGDVATFLIREKTLKEVEEEE